MERVKPLPLARPEEALPAGWLKIQHRHFQRRLAQFFTARRSYSDGTLQPHASHTGNIHHDRRDLHHILFKDDVPEFVIVQNGRVPFVADDADRMAVGGQGIGTVSVFVQNVVDFLRNLADFRTGLEGGDKRFTCLEVRIGKLFLLRTWLADKIVVGKIRTIILVRRVHINQEAFSPLHDFFAGRRTAAQSIVRPVSRSDFR